MKTHAFIMACAMLLLMADSVSGKNVQKIFVSPQGSAVATGSRRSPFGSLEQARDYLRRLRNEGKECSAIVYLRGGSYRLDRPFVLEPQDSCITFKAYRREVPVISGARRITGWKPLESNCPELSAEARGQVWTADIPRGWLFHYLFVDGTRAERSKSDHRFWREWNKDHSFGEPVSNGQKVFFKQGEPLKYLKEGDSEMVCILMQYGVMGNGVLYDINPEKKSVRWSSKQLYPTFCTSRDPYERGYRFENALCLIDRPGEWAVDSKKGKVYYWPLKEENLQKARVEAPFLYELVRLQGDESRSKYVRNVTFDGITFVYTDRLPEDQWPDSWIARQWEHPDATVYISGAEDCVLRNCRILNSGAYGVTLHHYAQHNRIEKCEIGWTGSGGVFLEGYGPGTLDVNTGNCIERNYIHDHGLGNYWHSPCVQIYQSSGNRIAYNLLQKSAYSAISLVGVHLNDMQDARYFFSEYQVGEFLWWKQYRIRYQDFPAEVQQGIRQGTFRFDPETVKPYLHTRNNLVEGNIISEPHMKLNEGGAVYAFSVGKGNRWLDNVAFKSSGMPASSIYALDNLAEFFTVKRNVYWINGVILDGVGARPTERGNDISDNVRVNYRPEFEARRGLDKLGKWYVNETGRETLDRKLEMIRKKVKKDGGWPAHALIGIPASEQGLPRLDEQYVLPDGAHVTIE